MHQPTPQPMRRHRTAAITLCIAATLTSATTSFATTAATPEHPAATTAHPHRDNPEYTKYFTQKVNWTEDCNNQVPKLPAGNTFLCAKLLAPMDWNDPSKGDITLGIGRLAEHSSANPWDGKRLLLSNPGGPGVDGLFFGAALGVTLKASSTHSSIGVSPRGVGLSTRAECTPPKVVPGTFEADGDHRTATWREIQTSTQAQFDFFQRCAQEVGPFAQYVTTDQIARDYNLVRAVLKYRQADFYGVSYGTYLGAYIGKLFPNSFDRIVLDSNTNFAADSLHDTFLAQPESFQAQYDRVFVPFLARHHHRFDLGATPEAVHDSIETMRQRIVNGELGPTVTGIVFDDALIGAQYSDTTWAHTGILLRKIKTVLAGDDSQLPTVLALLGVNQPAPPTMNASTLAVLCGDRVPPTNAWMWQHRNSDAATKYPLVGSRYRVPFCHGWPHSGAISDDTKNLPLGKVLMIHNEADPATSTPGALATRQTLGDTARLVYVDDKAGHGLAWTDNPCTETIVKKYLFKNQWPYRDQYCQAKMLSAITPAPAINVRDEYVYEFGHAASRDNPVPEPWRYLKRDLVSLPPVDEYGTWLWDRTKPKPAADELVSTQNADLLRETFLSDFLTKQHQGHPAHGPVR